MEVKAKLKYLRISTRKVRLVSGLIRGKKTPEALNQLTFANKKSALPMLKLLKSAIANAVNNFSLSEDNLFVKEVRVDQGPVLKRWMPRAHGRATPLRKGTSHINIVLAEINDTGVKEGKKQEIETPVKLGEKSKKEESKTTESGDSNSKLEAKKNRVKAEGGSKKGFTSKVFQRKAG
jgi:large subunit ribosomal protein L22